jgi:hypothetical protein
MSRKSCSQIAALNNVLPYSVTTVIHIKIRAQTLGRSGFDSPLWGRLATAAKMAACDLPLGEQILDQDAFCIAAGQFAQRRRLSPYGTTSVITEIDSLAGQGTTPKFSAPSRWGELTDAVGGRVPWRSPSGHPATTEARGLESQLSPLDSTHAEWFPPGFVWTLLTLQGLDSTIATRGYPLDSSHTD